MIVGLVKEIKTEEYRVALVPSAIIAISALAEKVLVQHNAGLASGYSDDDYQQAGAIILQSAEEVWEQSDLIIKVKEPQQSEFALMRPEQIVFTYFHFASSVTLTKACLGQKISALAYETLVDANGQLPLLLPMSSVAGKMAAHQAAKYLEKTFGGKGILMGGLDLDFIQVEPAKVIVLGGGVVGRNAAQVASEMGAEVTILELNQQQIEQLKNEFGSSVKILKSTQDQLHKLLKTADVIIGAVLVAGARAPKLIHKDDLSLMQPGTVLIDVAIDQGGCFETSRATTHDNPIYIEQGIVHYCVANLPGAVCRSSSQALSSATTAYILELINKGLEGFLDSSEGHRKCLNMRNGQLTHEVLQKEFAGLLH
jgi:alanine dehydrogenase